MPSVIPVMTADQEAAMLILAIVHANGGTIRRMDLARAFALRSQPEVITDFRSFLLQSVTTISASGNWIRANPTASACWPPSK